MNEREATEKLYSALIENTVWKAGFAAAYVDWNVALDQAVEVVKYQLGHRPLEAESVTSAILALKR